MRRVRSTNTQPEQEVRRLLHDLGARFRLDTGRKLPGNPDVVLRARRLVIFVHGCFWDQHSCMRGARRPSSRAEYWNAKLDRNIVRDRLVSRELRVAGWRVVVVWECELRHAERLRSRLARALIQSAPRNSM
jgi:DNA mismatch endonuclease (patch repair protein)